MSKRGRYGDGTLNERGPDIWRLRYRVGSQRLSVTFRGSKRDAQKELRRLIRASDTGEHALPSKVTLGAWIERWLAAGAPGSKQKQVGRQSLQRYGQLLRCHVVQVLGERPLQQLRADEIDTLYVGLRGKIAERTTVLVHVVLGACINAAVRQRVLPSNPMTYLSKVPSAPESDHGMALGEADVRRLLAGFRGHPLYDLVVMAIRTGARRNELLALRWADVDFTAKTLRIERSVEFISGEATTTKDPKTRRGIRAITLDDELLALLGGLRERHMRIAAGVPDGVEVDLRLIRLPEGALIFPGSPRDGFAFDAFRNPQSVTEIFSRVARQIGFPKLRFHDLRGTSITLMLNQRIPVHVVAARHGHDPAVMMRAYAKALPQDDAEAAKVIAEFSKGVL
jgi:integrase